MAKHHGGATTKTPHGGRRSLGLMHGSPLAWIAFIAGVIGILSSGSSWVWGYATLSSQVEAQKHELRRNFEEDKERNRSDDRRFERLEQTLSAMQKVSTDVEVVKVQLISINESLKRVERALDRPNGHHHGRK